MNTIKWDEMLLPYEIAVSEISNKFRCLSASYEALGLSSPIEMVSHRVKRPSSILAKAKRKGVPFDKIEEKIEDIAGVRLICRFIEDISHVAELIRARNGIDMTVSEERNYLADRKPSGYRSYHMIVKYPLQYALGRRDIMVEIQIRTMAMNYWAVIEHTLQYKHDGNMPSDISRRLKENADATALLDAEFSKLRGESGAADSENVSCYQMADELVKNIRLMYRAGLDVEAERFNERFHIYFGESDVRVKKDKMRRLLNESYSALTQGL